MLDLKFTVQHTPHGIRVAGPDPDRAVYLRPVQNGTAKVRGPTEPVWSSDEFDLFVVPTTAGVEVKLTIRANHNRIAWPARKAA